MPSEEEAMATLERSAFEYLMQIGRDYLLKKVAELAPGLTDEERTTVLNLLFAETDLPQDIAHHAEKVMEHGYNRGRLGARAEFLLDQWRLEGAESVEEDILFVVDKFKKGQQGQQAAK